MRSFFISFLEQPQKSSGIAVHESIKADFCFPYFSDFLQI